MKYDNLLLKAAEHGCTWLVKALLDSGAADPKAWDSEALRWAAYRGHTEIAKLLIPVSAPQAIGSYALRYAAYGGHTEIVKLLIPVSCLPVLTTMRSLRLRFLAPTFPSRYLM